MNTQHTPIPGFDGYAVTREGSVWSVASNWRGQGVRELGQTLNSDGYQSVRVMVGGKRKRVAVHGLMALAFYGPAPSNAHPGWCY